MYVRVTFQTRTYETMPGLPFVDFTGVQGGKRALDVLEVARGVQCTFGSRFRHVLMRPCLGFPFVEALLVFRGSKLKLVITQYVRVTFQTRTDETMPGLPLC